MLAGEIINNAFYILPFISESNRKKIHAYVQFAYIVRQGRSLRLPKSCRSNPIKSQLIVLGECTSACQKLFNSISQSYFVLISPQSARHADCVRRRAEGNIRMANHWKYLHETQYILIRAHSVKYDRTHTFAWVLTDDTCAATRARA
jgi:hypothetical protein